VKSISYEMICRLIRLFVTNVETSYLNADLCKFDSSQNEESRALSADFSKVEPTANLEHLIVKEFS